MFRNLVTAVLTILLLVSFTAVQSEARVASRDEALKKIIDEVIDVDVDQIRLYITSEPVEAGTEIRSWKRVEITAPAKGWAAFIDDHPTANFEHACRYVFVDEETGKIDVVNSMVPPRDEGTFYEYPTAIGKKLDAAPQIIPQPYTGPTYPVSNRGGGSAST